MGGVYPTVAACVRVTGTGPLARHHHIADRPSRRRPAGSRRAPGRAAGRSSCPTPARRPSDLVGDGHDRRVHHAAGRVGPAALVVERREAGHAERDVHDAPAPRPPERVAHDDGHLDAQVRARCAARMVARRGVRSRAAAASPCRRADVGGIDAGVGAHVAVPGARDDDAALHAHDVGGLAQDDLHLARVAVPALAERDRLRARA